MSTQTCQICYESLASNFEWTSKLSSDQSIIYGKTVITLPCLHEVHESCYNKIKKCPFVECQQVEDKICVDYLETHIATCSTPSNAQKVIDVINEMSNDKNFLNFHSGELSPIMLALIHSKYDIFFALANNDNVDKDYVALYVEILRCLKKWRNDIEKDIPTKLKKFVVDDIINCGYITSITNNKDTNLVSHAIYCNEYIIANELLKWVTIDTQEQFNNIISRVFSGSNNSNKIIIIKKLIKCEFVNNYDNLASNLLYETYMTDFSQEYIDLFLEVANSMTRDNIYKEFCFETNDRNMQNLIDLKSKLTLEQETEYNNLFSDILEKYNKYVQEKQEKALEKQHQKDLAKEASDKRQRELEKERQEELDQETMLLNARFEGLLTLINECKQYVVDEQSKTKEFTVEQLDDFKKCVSDLRTNVELIKQSEDFDTHAFNEDLKMCLEGIEKINALINKNQEKNQEKQEKVDAIVKESVSKITDLRKDMMDVVERLQNQILCCANVNDIVNLESRVDGRMTTVTQELQTQISGCKNAIVNLQDQSDGFQRIKHQVACTGKDIIELKDRTDDRFSAQNKINQTLEDKITVQSAVFVKNNDGVIKDLCERVNELSEKHNNSLSVQEIANEQKVLDTKLEYLVGDVKYLTNSQKQQIENINDIKQEQKNISTKLNDLFDDFNNLSSLNQDDAKLLKSVEDLSVKFNSVIEKTLKTPEQSYVSLEELDSVFEDVDKIKQSQKNLEVKLDDMFEDVDQTKQLQKNLEIKLDDMFEDIETLKNSNSKDSCVEYEITEIDSVKERLINLEIKHDDTFEDVTQVKQSQKNLEIKFDDIFEDVTQVKQSQKNLEIKLDDTFEDIDKVKQFQDDNNRKITEMYDVMDVITKTCSKHDVEISESTRNLNAKCDDISNKVHFLKLDFYGELSVALDTFSASSKQTIETECKKLEAKMSDDLAVLEQNIRQKVEKEITEKLEKTMEVKLQETIQRLEKQFIDREEQKLLESKRKIVDQSKADIKIKSDGKVQNNWSQVLGELSAKQSNIMPNENTNNTKIKNFLTVFQKQPEKTFNDPNQLFEYFAVKDDYFVALNWFENFASDKSTCSIKAWNMIIDDIINSKNGKDTDEMIALLEKIVDKEAFDTSMTGSDNYITSLFKALPKNFVMLSPVMTKLMMKKNVSPVEINNKESYDALFKLWFENGSIIENLMNYNMLILNGVIASELKNEELLFHAIMRSIPEGRYMKMYKLAEKNKAKQILFNISRKAYVANAFGWILYTTMANEVIKM